jgi:NADH-quinone oxidoreductase subunit M
MDFLRDNILTLLIFLPTVGAILTLLATDAKSVKWTALATTLVTFILSLMLFLPGMYDWSAGSAYAYESTGGTVQLVREASWIPAFNIQYKVGIDGLSFPLVILSTFICVLACIASWGIDRMTKGYMALFLFLETGIMGVFLALDFFLFYVFFEVSLLPMYFLIGIWGGPRKEYAAI